MDYRGKAGLIWRHGISMLSMAWVAFAISPPGFLSIDCGSDVSYNDSVTGLNWVTDFSYVSTGMNAKNISDFNSAQDATLRYFEGPRSKDCYVLPTRPGYSYLIRAFFYYGDWRPLSSTMSFNAYINASLWFSFSYKPGDYTYYSYNWEAVFFSPGSQLNFCLVRQQGPSFISSLELRELARNMYAVVGAKTFLDLWVRYNCGPDLYDPSFVRYPDDLYDRLWYNPGTWDNATHIRRANLAYSTANAPDIPPRKVMEDAWIYYNSTILWLYVSFIPGVVYTTAYFQAIDGNASVTNVRGMQFTLNDVYITSFNSTSQPVEIRSPLQTIFDAFINMSFIQLPWSNLHPMLNAVEMLSDCNRRR